MFQVTERAGEQLKRIISQQNMEENACLRIGATEEGLRMIVDQERLGDKWVEHDGESLLLMDSATADRLCGRRMDYDETTEQMVSLDRASTRMDCDRLGPGCLSYQERVELFPASRSLKAFHGGVTC